MRFLRAGEPVQMTTQRIALKTVAHQAKQAILAHTHVRRSIGAPSEFDVEPGTTNRES